MKSKFRHIMVKLQNMKDKDNASTEKKEITFKRTVIRLPTNFLTAKVDVRSPRQYAKEQISSG